MMVLMRHQSYFQELQQFSPPPLENCDHVAPDLPDITQALQHAGHQFQTISFNSWKFAGSEAHIKKEVSVCFSVYVIVASQDFVVGFDKAGIDIDNIVFIQRNASN